jgi:alpha-mannosidase
MAWRHELSQHFYKMLGSISMEAAFTKGQHRISTITEKLVFNPIEPGIPWGAKWEYGWFTGEIVIPEIATGQMIGLMIDVGAESAVYINGDYAGAVDEYHKVILLTDSAKAGEMFNIVIEAYGGHGPQEWRCGPTPPDRETVPEPPATQQVVGQSHYGIWQEVAFQLAMDVETLWEVRENIDEESLRVMEIDEALKDFTLIADFEQTRDGMLVSLDKARDRLKPLLEKRNGDSTPEMIGFGHGHIDVAWLWPLAETERKCVRTFSTQLKLMERYPDYKFLQSQPQLYVMVKEKYPDLYQKILDAVRRGQWIADGAAWVEPDTNISGGESLIRQLIHGLRFYKEEFGVSCELLWLPDVFGYSGALPQIMRRCGVKYFSTQKIFWAYHGGEPFPYNTFVWEGIDGSEVYAHFHNDYGSETKPSNVIQRWKERVQKDGFSKRLFPFGWGDGGGGPTREHLEFALRQRNLEGVPRFRLDAPMAYFKEQETAGWPDARYVGELYFQAHRGTYTSQAKTKALNRRAEFALRETELWGAIAMLTEDYPFPFEKWDENWKKVLLNQFHDILPGSSIHRVYEEAESQLSEVVNWSNETAQDAASCLIKEPEGLTVFNSLSWVRNELIKLPDGYHGLKDSDGKQFPIQVTAGETYAEVTVPSCGWEAYLPSKALRPQNSIAVKPQQLENNLMRVEFDDYGEITSIFDKVNNEELAAGRCNCLKMYQDIPSAFDAWDIDRMYRQTPVDLPEKADIEVVASGPLFSRMVIKRRLNNSKMTQTITLRRDTRRMDFHTVIDWEEKHKLLKVNFPVNYQARDALHEIQFGHLPRPTHRSREIDADRFEVCNHKWTALVEANRGFAILNDSKYGVDVLDNSINLTLLKSALVPDMTADRGRQEFTYAFYYWHTPFMESNLIQESYQLNASLWVQAGNAGFSSLFSVDAPNIIIETVKPPEDWGTKSVVIRLYESMGTRTNTRLHTSLTVKEVHWTDMREQTKSTQAVTDGNIDLVFAPFEIVTLRLNVA